MDHGLEFLLEALVFLVAAVIVAPIFERLRFSLVLGYLVAGVLIGPSVLGLISYSKTVHDLAELGVVFLLFAIGLELSTERLWNNRRLIFGLGTLQVVITAAAIAVMVFSSGFPLEAAIIIGGGLALSSTAVVLELLSERGELTTRRGQLALSILLLQDLAVVPLLALVTVFSATGEGTLVPLLWTLAYAVAALAGVMFVGRLVLRPLLRIIATGRSNELMVAVTLALLLGLSSLTASLGLSLAIGGFLAGILLAETEYRHQVASDVRPFRGLLLGLFFMTVGISLDLEIVATNLLLILGIVAGFIALKSAILFLLGWISGVGNGRAINLALLLAGAGEFGFVVFALAGTLGLIEQQLTNILAAAIALSMAVTPLLAAIGNSLNTRLDTASGDKPDDILTETLELSDHVVVAGFGRVGQSVVKTLCAASIPYDAIDSDLDRVVSGREKGYSVYFGDAGHLGVLEALGIERARAIVVILDNAVAVEQIVHLVRAKYPKLEIFVRARDTSHMERLAGAGADAIIHETYEMSLHLGESVLREYGLNEARIHQIVGEHRANDYDLLRS